MVMSDSLIFFYSKPVNVCLQRGAVVAFFLSAYVNATRKRKRKRKKDKQSARNVCKRKHAWNVYAHTCDLQTTLLCL